MPVKIRRASSGGEPANGLSMERYGHGPVGGQRPLRRSAGSEVALECDE